MIETALTVCLVPEARRGPFVSHQDIRASCALASELGFGAIELFASEESSPPPGELARALEENGLKLAAVGTGAGWVQKRLSLCDPDPDRRAQALMCIGERIRYGARFSAPAIIGSMQGSHGGNAEREQAMSWIHGSLQILGALASNEGVPLLFEPLNRYETDICNTLEQAAELCKALPPSQVRLLADTFHMNIEEADPAAALREALPRIGHVHFVDSNRRAAGMGHMDLQALARELRKGGYSGFVSCECFPLPDARTAASASIDAWKRLFG